MSQWCHNEVIMILPQWPRVMARFSLVLYWGLRSRFSSNRAYVYPNDLPSPNWQIKISKCVTNSLRKEHWSYIQGEFLLRSFRERLFKILVAGTVPIGTLGLELHDTHCVNVGSENSSLEWWKFTCHWRKTNAFTKIHYLVCIMSWRNSLYFKASFLLLLSLKGMAINVSWSDPIKFFSMELLQRKCLCISTNLPRFHR